MVSLQKTTLKMVDRSLRLLQFWGGHMWKDLHSSENISFLGSRDTHRLSQWNPQYTGNRDPNSGRGRWGSKIIATS